MDERLLLYIAAFLGALLLCAVTLLIVLLVQIGLSSPPVGMNLFVLNTLLKNVPLKQIFRGVWIFVLMLAVALFIMLEFPVLSMWLPGFMK